MGRVFVPTVTASDWQLLLAKPSLHWAPGRSAMCAADCWESAGDKLPAEIQAAFNAARLPELTALDLVAAFPEWGTSLPGGARQSFTDVVALASNAQGLCLVAVEAKADEDFGPILQEKRAAASAGQLERIAYLEQLLGARFDDKIRYQLLHRTASAVLAARSFHARTAVMLVHSFGKRTEVQDDFLAFCAAMGAERVSPDMHAVRRFDKPTFFLAWVDGHPRHREAKLPWHPSVPVPT